MLEGGGMRGVYTAGVLDEWAMHGVEFESIYGVSAGAIQACSFISKQQRRGYECTVNYLDDWRYCSIRSLLLTGNLFGVKMCYETIPNKLHPFQYDVFTASATKLFAVTTDIDTGEAVYLPVRDMLTDTIIIRASASLPFVSRPVRIGERRLLDGGVADSIPLLKALQDGNMRCVVVLTQDASYQKTSSDTAMLAKLCYPRCRAFREKLQNRHQRYNDQLAMVKKMEAEGRAFVIRPQKPVTFSRVEKDKMKLEALYQDGRKDAQCLYSSMLNFLKG